MPTVTGWSHSGPDVSDTRKSLLLILRSSPYGNGLARAGVDLALAAAAFDQDVSLLFMDEGIWQLLPQQDSAHTPGKNIARLLDSLPLYDIETLYVDGTSMVRRQLEPGQLSGNTQVLDEAELRAFVEGFDQVMGF